MDKNWPKLEKEEKSINVNALKRLIAVLWSSCRQYYQYQDLSHVTTWIYNLYNARQIVTQAQNFGNNIACSN